MGMDDLDLLVNWECDTPHEINGIKPDFCRFCPLYTKWTVDNGETCLEDTWDSTVADGTTYNYLDAAYDF